MNFLLIFSAMLSISIAIRSDFDNTASVSSPNILLGSTCSGSYDYSNVVYCPDQKWAYGFQIVSSENYGVLNIILDCRSQHYSYPESSSWNVSTSTLVNYANLGTFDTFLLKYSSFAYCSGRDFIRGYFLRMWCPASVSDNPQGIVEVIMRCSSNSNITTNFQSTNAATWTGYSYCKPGFAVCGYQMKYNTYTLGSYYGAVDIDLKCCRVCDVNSGFYFSAKNVCDFCDITCKECSGTSTNCTKCPPGYVLTISNTCTTSTSYTLIDEELFSTYTYDLSWTSNYWGNMTTSCTPFSFIGGYNVFRNDNWLIKTLLLLPTHTQIEYRFILYKIRYYAPTELEGPLFYSNDCGSSNYIQETRKHYIIFSDSSFSTSFNISSNFMFWAINRFQALTFICHSSCNTCSGTASNQCTSCSSGYISTSGTCAATCPTATFAVLETGICSTTCPFPMYKDKVNNKCSLYCQTNYYINDADRVCYNSCPTGTYGNPLTMKCVESCPDGMYGDMTSNLCGFCIFNCDTCVYSSTNCINCKYAWLGTLPGCSNPSYLQIIENRIFMIESVSHSNVLSSGWTITGALNTTNYGNQWMIGWWTYKLVGGKGVFGYGTSIKKSFTNLSSHLYARLTFYFSKIGTWYYNKLIVNLDGSTTLSILSFNYNDDIKCDNNDIDVAICYTAFRRVDVYFPHSSTNMDISIMTDLTVAAGESFWGISDLTLMISLCHSSCKTCFLVDDATQCMSCISGYFLQVSPGPSSCLLACPSNKYKNNTNNTCLSCDLSCLTCQAGASSDCLSCSGTYLISPPGPSICSPSCNLGTYANSTNQECFPCDTTCEGCFTDGVSSCTSCNTGKYLQISPSGPSECLTTCPNHTYPDPATQICENCDGSCDECIAADFSSCTKCATNYLLLPPGPSLCSNSCPTHTYPDAINHICNHCDSSCDECNGSSVSSCTKCATNYLEFPPGPSLCSNSCILGTYINSINHECSLCDPSCKGCLEAGTYSCTSCNAGKYLKIPSGPSQCIETCEITYYQDVLTNECRKCDTSCYECVNSGPSFCLSCNSDKYLNNITGPTTCLSCNSQCLSCMNASESSCLSCPQGLYLQTSIGPSSCLTSCPQGLFPDSSDNICKCARGCKACIGLTTSDCLSCSFNLYLQKSVGPASCLSDCPNMTFKSDIDHICHNCHKNCYNCFGTLSSECLSCISGNFLDNSTNSCKICDSSCKECINKESIGCTECKSGYYFQKNNGSLIANAGKCLDYPKIIPILKNNTSALSYILTFSLNYTEIYLLYMSKTKIEIDGINGTCYNFNITLNNVTNNFSIDFYNLSCSITEYPLMHVNLNPPTYIFSNYSTQLSTYNLTIQMQYYYHISENQKATINRTSHATAILNSATSKSFTFNNLLSYIFNFIFQCLISLYLIWFLRYFCIKYPENVLSIFKISPSPSVIPQIAFNEEVTDGYLPAIFRNYGVSIYGFNNNGNIFIENTANWILGFVALFLLSHFKNSQHKYIRISVDLFYKVFVWSYGMGFFLSNYMLFSFYALISFRYPCTKTNKGHFNLFYSIFIGISVIVIIPLLFIKMKKMRNKIIPSNHISPRKLTLDIEQIIKENSINKIKGKQNVVEKDSNIFIENFDSISTSKQFVNEISFSPKVIVSNKLHLENNLQKKSKFYQIYDSLSQKKLVDLQETTLSQKNKSFEHEISSEIDCKNLNDLDNNTNSTNYELARYNLMIKDFKQTNIFQSSFILLNLLKQLIYTIIIALMYDKPYSGLILLMILNIIYILYIIVINPFKEIIDFLHNLLNEFCVLCAIISAFCMAYMDFYGIVDEEMKIDFGWAIVFSNLVLISAFLLRMILSWIIIIYSTLKANLIKKIKKNQIGIDERKSKKNVPKLNKIVELKLN